MEKFCFVQVFIAKTSETTGQHYPFPSPFWIPKKGQHNPLFLLRRWIQTTHVWLGCPEHPIAAEINGKGLFLPWFSHLKSLWNIVTWKDVMHCFVLRNALSWAEIHHNSSSCCCSWGKFGIFSVFQQVSSLVRVATSTQQCWIPLLHQYLHCPFCIAPPQISHSLLEQGGTHCHHRCFSRVMFTQTAAEIISRLNPSLQKWGTMQSFSNEVH